MKPRRNHAYFIHGHKRLWMCLHVTQMHIDEGLQVDAPGNHFFGGLWYGDDPYEVHHYGKILQADTIGEHLQVEVEKLSLRQLKKLLD